MSYDINLLDPITKEVIEINVQETDWGESYDYKRSY